jgi:putative FmdB family regulatory protein
VPTYSYACTACGHEFETVQAMTDPSLTDCPSCGGRLRKVFHPVGVTFKGSGFYRTDSRAGGSGTTPAGSGSDKASAGTESGASTGAGKSDTGSSGSGSGGSSGAASGSDGGAKAPAKPAAKPSGASSSGA